MISVQNVSKSFGPVKALQNISFEIKQGGVVGFLGPNGAGKTTMMRLITGFFPPTEGAILIDGQDLFGSKSELRRKIGYLAENNPLYRDMTSRDFLSYVGALKDIPRQARKAAIQKVVDQCGVGSVLNRIIGKLSKGFQQRIGLAQALLGNPELLILDEPTNGLDPKQIIEIRSLIQMLGRERTVLLSTHVLPEVRVTCQQILILNGGRLVASGAPEDLEENLRHSEEFTVTIRGLWQGGDRFLHEIPDVLDVRLERDRSDERDYRIRSRKAGQTRSQIARVVTESGFELLELKTAEWSLEDLFLKIVTNEESLVVTEIDREEA